MDLLKFQLKKMIKNQENKPNIQKQKQIKKSLKLVFKKISRNGILEVDFNQFVFEIPHNQLAKRKLNATDFSSWIERYDVAYDLFDFVYVKNSDLDQKYLQFHVSLKEWTSKKMRMHISFKDPMNVSRGTKKDVLLMQVKPEA